MAEQIDWGAMGPDGMYLHDMAFLVDTWRNLAVQEREENERLRWMVNEVLRLNTAYPKVMKESLERRWEELKRTGTILGWREKWPFR